MLIFSASKKTSLPKHLAVGSGKSRVVLISCFCFNKMCLHYHLCFLVDRRRRRSRCRLILASVHGLILKGADERAARVSNMKWLILRFLLQMLVAIVCVSGVLNETCTTTSLQVGRCVLPINCEYALKILRSTYISDEEWYYLHNNKCGTIREGRIPKPLVCVDRMCGCDKEVKSIAGSF